MFRHTIRLYPDEEQVNKINLACAVSRKVYNYGLEKKIQAHTRGEKLSCFDIDKQLRNDKGEERKWIRGVSKRVRQQSLARLDDAFKRFFKKQNGFPNFKKYQHKESFDILDVKAKGNKIRLFRIGYIKYMGNIPEGKIKTCTVKRLSTGKFEMSLVIDDGFIPPCKEEFTREDVLGIDVGIKQFCVTSRGEFVDNPRRLTANEKKLKREQRKLSKKKKGSENINKQRNKLALVHEKIANQRKDFHHKLSKRFVVENKAIAVEDLNIKGMVKNHCLAKSISQVGRGTFISMIDYKCNRYGKTLLKIGRFEPSSKTCSNCGGMDTNLKLSDRTYNCSTCLISLDRDLNAAINIKNFSIKI